MFQTAASMSSAFAILKPFKAMAQRLPTQHDAIVVSSFGRAGSTLIYDALIKGMAQDRFGSTSALSKRIVQDVAMDLSKTSLNRGVVYKSHDYPDPLANKNGVRAIFLFGSPTDAALSVHVQKSLRSEDWVKSHFEHLRRPYDFEGLLTKDVLGFRDQCIAWMGFEEIPVLCMRYEGLWDNAAKISEFCGFKVTLPGRRPRKPKEFAPKALAQAQQTYVPLEADLAKMPDCFVAEARYGEMIRSSF